MTPLEKVKKAVAAAVPLCEVCGARMPVGEEMFKFHGNSAPCPMTAKTVIREFRYGMQNYKTSGDVTGLIGYAYAFLEDLSSVPQQVQHLGLEDVLRAIEKHGLDDQAQYYEILRMLVVGNARMWHLGKPLDEQSPETIASLYSLLCTNI